MHSAEPAAPEGKSDDQREPAEPNEPTEPTGIPSSSDLSNSRSGETPPDIQSGETQPEFRPTRGQHPL